MRSSIDLIMRGLKAADTMRRRRAWRGLSMLIMEPKKSSISLGHVDRWRWRPGRTGRSRGAGWPPQMWRVARQRVVAVALRDDVGERLGDLGLLVEGHRALTPQRLEGALPLVPGPGPELGVGEVDLVGGQDGAGFHGLPPYPGSLHCDHVRHAVRPGPARHGVRQELGPPAGRGPDRLALRPPRLGRLHAAHAVPLHRRHRRARRRSSRARPGCGAPSTGSTSTASPSGTSVSARPTMPRSAKPALIGMDLVRLGLERARSAAEAVDVMAGLLETLRAGWHRRRRPPGGLRLLVPHRRPDPGVRARDGRRRTTPSPRSPPAWPSPTGSRSAPGGRRPRPAWRRARTSTASATPDEDTAFADVRLAASRRFLASTAFRRAHPGGHRRPPARSRHGTLGCARHRRARRRAAGPGGRRLAAA